MLAVVICAIALSLAYPVREYLAQRQQIGQLVAQQQTMLTQVKNLQAEQARLSDRSYIEQLARQELDMCFPGAQCYIVEGGHSPLAAPGQRDGTRTLVREVVAFGRTGGLEPGEVITAQDAAVIAAQLGRPPRGLLAVAHRCPCGLPDVAETSPEAARRQPVPHPVLPDVPAGVRRRQQAGGLGADARDDRQAGRRRLRGRYEAAHRDYLTRREAAARAAGVEPLPPGTPSAGGMPERVKCLHALVAHELAVGEVNPFGREALEAAGEWWRPGPCVPGPAGGLMTRRVAAVDCGTNSLRLLIADVDPAGPR